MIRDARWVKRDGGYGLCLYPASRNLHLTSLVTRHSSPSSGFTLIELLVVLAIVATLLTLAAPRYFSSLDRSKEAVLKENLFQMRDSIGKYYADKGKYPESVETLATEKYLRKVPLDPITESTTTWIAVPPEDPQKSGVSDVRSGAQGKGSDGSAYGEW